MTQYITTVSIRGFMNNNLDKEVFHEQHVFGCFREAFEFYVEQKVKITKRNMGNKFSKMFIEEPTGDIFHLNYHTKIISHLNPKEVKKVNVIL